MKNGCLGPVSGGSVGANNYSPSTNVNSPIIKHGNVITVEIGKKPDFWEDNWYKVLTGTAVAVGVYTTLHR